MAKSKKRRKAKGTTIRRGSCRVVRGAVRICMSKGGKLTVSASGPRKSRKTTKKRKTRKGSTRKVMKKLKKPKSCKSKPAVRNGVCRCRLKSGKLKKLRIAYCRKPRTGGKRKKR
jgi:hypothetical protein